MGLLVCFCSGHSRRHDCASSRAWVHSHGPKLLHLGAEEHRGGHEGNTTAHREEHSHVLGYPIASTC
eukprot:1618392-Pyramimonas_sp.AAC.1